ncbi:DUF4827 family protein [Limibacterium fermenti]|uniref:DUF4827 family protein n=1 Tax=Limibacterium fermenti TaxID=3229863 RepID=UPI000E836C1E|nr:hypothetical protein [Porphyromonadaceae bacterium]
MKQISPVFLLLAALALITASCNNQKTYADHLKEETKAIKKFINENDLIILKTFPSDTTFRGNEFYQDPYTGVYFQITNRGQINNKVSIADEVYVRYSGLSFFMSDDTTKYNNNNPATSPDPGTFVYYGTVTGSTVDAYRNATTTAWAVPLQYIGHTGRVKMIVPFAMGSSYDRSNFQPTYYESVQYRFSPYK